MQEVSKGYGVSPSAGCLPLLVQLPVLYGMVFSLHLVLHATGLAGLHTINSTIYPFLPHFAALPNVYLHWLGLNLKLGESDPSHILAVLAGVANVLQLR